jgi:hypothetical protein
MYIKMVAMSPHCHGVYATQVIESVNGLIQLQGPELNEHHPHGHHHQQQLVHGGPRYLHEEIEEEYVQAGEIRR